MRCGYVILRAVLVYFFDFHSLCGLVNTSTCGFQLVLLVKSLILNKRSRIQFKNQLMSWSNDKELIIINEHHRLKLSLTKKKKKKITSFIKHVKLISAACEITTIKIYHVNIKKVTKICSSKADTKG